MRKFKTVLTAVLAAVMALMCVTMIACGNKGNGNENKGFDKQTVFHLDLTMGTAIGPLSDLCNPGTITFGTDGKAKMNITFTDSALVMMDNLLGFRISDFVHDDTYELSDDKSKILYHSTRMNSAGDALLFGDMEIAIVTLSDGSMKFTFDIGKAIPETVLYFYSNPNMIPSGEEPDKEEKKSYALSYSAGGGILNEGAELPQPEVFDEETDITLPDVDFYKEGCIFRGWAIYGLTGLGLYQPGDEYTVKGDVEFVAVWDGTVTYSFIDGNGLGQTFEASVGATVVFPECSFAVKDGKQGFAYWTQVGDEKQNKRYPGDTFKVTEDAVFIANFTDFVTITFTPGTEGKGTAYSMRIPASSQFYMPACDFTNENTSKGFASWQVGSSKVKAGDKCKSVTADTEITAVWDTYVTVTFNANGAAGTAPQEIRVVKGTYFTFPEHSLTAPKNARFGGWSTKADSASGLKQPNDKTTTTKNVTYYAQWDYKRYVKFNTGIEGKEVETPTIRMYARESVTMPEMPYENGDYRFAFWATDSAATSGINPGNKTLVPEGAALTDVTFYAVWDKKVNVTFAGGTDAVGSMDPVEDVYERDKITLPECMFTKEGYAFDYWKIGTSTTKYNPGREVAVPRDGATVTAQWAKIATVTFAGGEDATGSTDFVSGAKIVLPECGFSKEGYVFSHWKIGTATTKYKPGNSYTVPAAGATATAQWLKIETVAFAGGEDATGSVSEVKGGATLQIKLPANGFTKTEYTFVGWQDAQNKVYAEGENYTVPAGGATLTAVWGQNITVKFAGGAGATGTMSDVYGAENNTVTLPECKFVKDGYSFVGWQDIEGKIFAAGAKMPLPAYADEPTVTLKAVWTKGAYASYTAIFRAAQASVEVYKDADGKSVTLNNFFPGGSMTELVLRPDRTADLVLKTALSSDDFTKHKSVGRLALSYSKFKSMFNVEYRNVPYEYDDKTNTVTLDLGNGETLVFVLKKVAKGNGLGYDSVQFEYTLQNVIGAVTKLTFAAIDGKPAYLTSQKTFKGAVPADAPSFANTPIELTVNTDGTGKLKASILGLNFTHQFTPDMKTVIWLGDEGDSLEGAVGESGGKMTLTVTMLGQTIVLTEQ